jgi:hypothetical protein
VPRRTEICEIDHKNRERGNERTGDEGTRERGDREQGNKGTRGRGPRATQTNGRESLSGLFSGQHAWFPPAGIQAGRILTGTFLYVKLAMRFISAGVSTSFDAASLTVTALFRNHS